VISTVKETIIKHIIERLNRDKEAIMDDFNSDKGIQTKFAAIDGLLPAEITEQIYKAFPAGDKMRLLDSFREKKYTSKSLSEFDQLISDVTFAFQDERVINLVSEMTGIVDAVGDPHLYAGGISAMAKGHFLNPHLDNSHDHEQKNYRVLNLLLYVTPDWAPENGGNLELWDEKVTKAIEIPSAFNRLVLMSTNDKSFHSVNEVKSEGRRCCVSNYYFSPHSPNGYETTHVTYFQARPDQTVRRLITKADSEVRTLLRRVKKSGFSKKDLFESENDSK
jgi:Rps23 Pro-64 3,4-dihydroxylase Tpa1-like proline 4-hydroxylase